MSADCGKADTGKMPKLPSLLKPASASDPQDKVPQGVHDGGHSTTGRHRAAAVDDRLPIKKLQRRKPWSTVVPSPPCLPEPSSPRRRRRSARASRPKMYSM